MQNRLLAINHQGVAGIVTALETYYSFCFFSQQIYNLAFAFIAPLGANDYYILAHLIFLALVQVKNLG